MKNMNISSLLRLGLTVGALSSALAAGVAAAADPGSATNIGAPRIVNVSTQQDATQGALAAGHCAVDQIDYNWNSGSTTVSFDNLIGRGSCTLNVPNGVPAFAMHSTYDNWFGVDYWRDVVGDELRVLPGAWTGSNTSVKTFRYWVVTRGPSTNGDQYLATGSGAFGDPDHWPAGGFNVRGQGYYDWIYAKRQQIVAELPDPMYPAAFVRADDHLTDWSETAQDFWGARVRVGVQAKTATGWSPTAWSTWSATIGSADGNASGARSATTTPTAALRNLP
jgi:hypothetical protein